MDAVSEDFVLDDEATTSGEALDSEASMMNIEIYNFGSKL